MALDSALESAAVARQMSGILDKYKNWNAFGARARMGAQCGKES